MREPQYIYINIKLLIVQKITSVKVKLTLRVLFTNMTVGEGGKTIQMQIHTIKTEKLVSMFLWLRLWCFTWALLFLHILL